MSKETYLYRHDEIILPRPYECDVDADDWLWQGTIRDRLLGHNLRTAQLRVAEIPEMEGKVVFSSTAFGGKVFLLFGDCSFYLVYNPQTGTTQRYKLPGERPNCWYRCKLPDDKLMVFDRRHNHALIFDAPDATPRSVPCPYPGDLGAGTLHSDGLVYIFLADPARLVRFDIKSEQFLDETPLPWPDVAVTGRVEHHGVLYCADSAGGRLLPLNMQTQQWGEPIHHPHHGTVFGFIGLGFGFGGKAYFCLSTYSARSRIDKETGKIILPDAGQPLSVDGHEPRFMERFLVFNPEDQSFDYLIAPEQPDGLPLLCYAWNDDNRFLITGFVLPWEKPGVPRMWDGPWLILQSEEAAEEPGFERYDFNWDWQKHWAANRRTYPWTASLFIPEPTHSPAITNMEGSAAFYPAGKANELVRRAARTDRAAYWKRVVERLLPPDADTATRFRIILEHARSVPHDSLPPSIYVAPTPHSLYYNPIQVLDSTDPIAIHQAHDARCGQGAALVLALCEAAGIEARPVPLQNHVVTEAFYGGSWHYGDPLFFGGNQPAREGRVLSADELKADPYFADKYPQQCFAYDPELLLSEDNFQVQGYVFGPWGSEPYYSFYLGAPKDQPPTLPTLLPARRSGNDRVEIIWSPSIKLNGGRIEYELRIYEDRWCRHEILRHTSEATSFVWQVPQQNWMYFIEVRAVDEHRTLQPDTWYPAARHNFVLVPKEQYGWYGVL